MMLNNRRDPELSGTYRFRWHHCPSKGECGPTYKLVPPDFDDADKCEATSFIGDKSKKKKARKKAKKKRTTSVSDGYNSMELAVKNEPHSEEYAAILAQREESRKARQIERAQGLEALPPISDDKSAAIRRQFLEDQERKDYALKERELDEDNAEKLRKYRATLERRQQRVQQSIAGMGAAPGQTNETSKAIEDLDVVVDVEHAPSIEKESSLPERNHVAMLPCTCSCKTTQRSPKANGNNCAASIKNRRAQQQLASDIELLERKFEKEDKAEK